MVDYQMPTSFTTPFSAKAAQLRDSASIVSGDESIFPASTLSMHSDFDSSSDMTSLLMTARSTSPTMLLGESGFHTSLGHKDPREPEDFEKWTKHENTDLTPFGTNDTSLIKLEKQDTPSTFVLEQDSGRFTPIYGKGVISPRSRTPSPGISKMLLSLSDHSVERPCSPNASTLYKNTKTHCNPSELGQQTYDECMMFTQWANTFLQHSLDQFLITDLARDLGDGITLLSLVEMLVGEYPPQIHIKPALDVQKMENIQTCLDFLEHYGVSVNGITADDIVKGNLKVVLALCHSLQRHFGSTAAGNPQVDHLGDRYDLSLFNWVSKITGKQVVDFQSFQDGTVLCLLLNKILEGVIPNLVLEYGSAAEKIGLVLKVSSEQLSIGTCLQADAIINQRCQEKFVEYLKSLYQVYSNKSGKVNDAFGQRSLRRELKRQQLREQRLKTEPRGSDLTYLGELSQNKPRITQEKLQVPLADASKDMSDSETLNGTRRQIDELEHLSLTNGYKKMPSNGTLNSTKRQLDELKQELELLKLELSDSRYDNGGKSFTTPDSLSQGYSTSSTHKLKAPSTREKPTNARLELRDLYRGSTNANMSEKSRKIIENRHSPVAKNETVSEAESKDGQPLFGGCYLGEIPSSYDNSGRRGMDHSKNEPSFTIKEMDMQPRSSIHQETRTFPPHDFPHSLLNSKSDRLSGSGSSVHVKPYTMETKGISNLFEVDFGDEDVKKNRDRENLALKRMLRAGSQSKLERGRLRHDLDSVHSTSQGEVKLNGEAKKKLLSLPNTEDRRKQLNRSLGVFSSRKPMSQEEKLYKREQPSMEALSKVSNEQHKQLQRSPSKEKRYREQVLAKKSARSVQPPSTRTHLNALTALIRMSAKNADAVCGEEAQ
ncbi:uncharacterized protein LOC144638732 isoform X1 [Oculina patagonica]